MRAAKLGRKIHPDAGADSTSAKATEKAAKNDSETTRETALITPLKLNERTIFSPAFIAGKRAILVRPGGSAVTTSQA